MLSATESREAPDASHRTNVKETAAANFRAEQREQLVWNPGIG